MSRPLVSRGLARLPSLPHDIALQLPQGQQLGAADAPVKLLFSSWSSIARFKAGQVGALAEDYVEGKLQLEGAMRDVMQAVTRLLPGNPVDSDTAWWRALLQRARSLAAHTPAKDAAQIQFHYDVSDAFYELWLDARRIYSCAYYRDAAMTLAQAQEAKLDHICRKLMLKPGERFLDIGAGWGALLLWAAEHYGVIATGITLSKNQHAHVQRLIADKGLSQRVRMELRDYRDLPEAPEAPPFDKISSVGMFEHVGQANMAAYFGKIMRLMAPGGLVLNHGITAGGVDNRQLGAGMGEFIEKYIFPGGELLHVSAVLEHLARSGLEMLDTENLRPHYARTLWDWSDALEAQLDAAREVLAADGGPERAEKTLRAYRLYLAGSAMSFEQGWLALHQLLASRPTGNAPVEALKGARSAYPFSRDYMYR
ncbi:MAG: class I SAM-dependent methyltransferase [Polaromonas sp.]